MINTDRIVPVTAIDLISLYGLIIKAAGTTLTAVNAKTSDGKFQIDSASNALIASEPVQHVNIASAVTSATIYFVPGYDYAGFSLNNVEVETAGADVVADGKTLYTATLATGTVTIAKVGF